MMISGISQRILFLLTLWMIFLLTQCRNHTMARTTTMLFPHWEIFILRHCCHLLMPARNQFLNQSTFITPLQSTNSSSDYVPVLISAHKGEKSLAICPRVTCGAHGIVKPNPKYALSVAACKVPVPKSSRIALINPEWHCSLRLTRLWKMTLGCWSHSQTRTI